MINWESYIAPIGLGGVVLFLIFALDFVTGFEPAPISTRLGLYAIPGVPFLIGLAMVLTQSAVRSVSFGTLICPQCNTQFPLNSPWVCGYCKTTHDRFDRLFRNVWTFIDPCPVCEHKPHSLWCYRCRKPIIFYRTGYGNTPKDVSYLSQFPPEEKPATAGPSRRRLEEILE